MEFKGTKGGWKKSKLSTNLFIRDNNPQNEIDCNCVDVDGHEAGIMIFAEDTLKEKRANVNLIAQAPNLLKSLQDLVSDVKGNELDDKQRELVKQAESTIKKAING